MVTEYSMDTDINGKPVQIPTLVPTLTPDEVRQMTDVVIPNHAQLPPSIRDKALAFAKQRIDAGLSPFATDAQAPAGPAGVPGWNQLYAEEQQQALDRADAKKNELRQDLGVSLSIATQNAEAQARAGVMPTDAPRSKAEFMAAYKDPVTAEHAWARYSTARQTAIVVPGLNGKSTADLLTVLQSRPDAADPNFAVTAENQGIQSRAAAAIIEARQRDPAAYAIQTGDFKFQPIDPADPGPELQRRAAAMPGMMEKYGTAGMMTKGEADLLGRQLASLPAEQKVQQLEGIRQSIGDDAIYTGVLNAIRPDSPVTALVGNIAAAGDPAAARDIAHGEDLLNPTKEAQGKNGKGAFPMPTEGNLRLTWDSKVGDAYRGYPEAQEAAYQAFKAAYAAMAARKGLSASTYADVETADAAIQAATGGVATWGIDFFPLGNETPDHNIVLPYGMPEQNFRDRFTAKWNAMREGLGYPTTDATEIGLFNTGANGEYQIMSGTSWLPDQHGKPIVVKVD